jgi:PAS domain S-box-containing protein
MDALHRALLDAAFDPCMILEPDGTVLAVNQPMCARLDRPENMLVGCDVRELFPEDVANRRMTLLDNAIQRGRRTAFEDEGQSGVTFEGVIQPLFSDNGEPEVLVVTVRDVTGPRRAEEQRVRLATAIEQAMESIIIMDNDWTVQYVNQSFEAMTGYSLHEMSGSKVDLLYKGEDQQRVLKNVACCLEYTDSWAGRTNNTRKDGRVFECEQTISRIRTRRGQPLGFVSVWRDVTEMAALERQVRQAQKMEAVGALAGGLAHDFNNVLGPIILYTELSLEGLSEHDSLRPYFQEILSAAGRARSLVEQILGLSRRREQDKPVPFKLSSIVKECLKLLRPTLPPSINIVFKSHANSDTVVADPTQIHQVIMNLCTNAAQAMSPDDGVLEIALREEEVEADCPVHRDVRPGRYLRLEIRDTGHGIPPQDLERIFDPFYTTKRDGKGAGLGLAVVQNIVGHLGGGVEVQSEVGVGSLFAVLLPCSPRDGDLTIQTSSESAPEEEGGLHVLLVDDDTHMRHGVGCLLNDLGHQVTDCRNGFEALALFRQNPESYDMLMTEASLNELSGLELAREAHYSRPDLPVVFLSGGSLAAQAERYGSCGVHAVLEKPPTPDEMKQALSTACGQTVAGKE